MNDHRFDTFARNLATRETRRSLIQGFSVAIGASFGALWIQAAAKGDKAVICHRTGPTTNSLTVIEVSAAAYAAHIEHGDVPCGAMVCEGTGFLTYVCPETDGARCDAVYRECAPGTECKAFGVGGIICDWPTP